MTKKLVLLSIFCMTVFILFAQKQQNNQKELITFTEKIHDYGTIEVGSPGDCIFKFTNNMKTALVISNVKPSCGCTVANWPKEPVLPGKTGVIKLNYNTKIPGTFNKTIVVTSNAKNANVLLRIKGNVIRLQK